MHLNGSITRVVEGRQANPKIITALAIAEKDP